jgi:hypothetical protein
MMLNNILGWAEVWALIIPILFIRYTNHSRLSYLKPLIWYLFIALVLNIGIDLISHQKKYNIELGWHNNSLLYNIHSISRLLLFSLFFIRLNQPFLRLFKKLIPLLFLLFIAINFFFFESIMSFSSRLLTVEAVLLLFYCLSFYVNLMQKNYTISYKRNPAMWFVTGLCIYIVIGFPIFLFYTLLSVRFTNFAIDLWNVHNIGYIIFCIFLAKAFYESKHN